uniref:Ig-like domain-containing protein n=1 Tax=Syphacia muris TaxID=451379 RepID=A0A0N5AAW9_9BILA
MFNCMAINYYRGPSGFECELMSSVSRLEERDGLYACHCMNM